jgi:hypothetical protein
MLRASGLIGVMTRLEKTSGAVRWLATAAGVDGVENGNAAWRLHAVVSFAV